MFLAFKKLINDKKLNGKIIKNGQNKKLISILKNISSEKLNHWAF